MYLVIIALNLGISPNFPTSTFMVCTGRVYGYSTRSLSRFPQGDFQCSNSSCGPYYPPNIWFHYPLIVVVLLLEGMLTRSLSFQFSPWLISRSGIESHGQPFCELKLWLSSPKMWSSWMVSMDMMNRFGVSIHLKLYPIIYSLALLLRVGSPEKGRASIQANPVSRIWARLSSLRAITFSTIAAVTFITATAGLYMLYGWEFLYETYLYHLIRRDNRHNFSLWVRPLHVQFWWNLLLFLLFVHLSLMTVIFTTFIWDSRTMTPRYSNPFWTCFPKPCYALCCLWSYIPTTASFFACSCVPTLL